MTSCVFDTNMLIYYLNNAGGEEFHLRFDSAVKKGVCISVITRIEVLGWPGYAEILGTVDDAEALLRLLWEEPLTDGIASKAIIIRRQYRLKVPDAIIAATALELGLPLTTHNIADFKRVPNLALIDPFARVINVAVVGE